MALPKVQKYDTVEVTFKNFEKMHRDQYGMFASNKRDDDALIEGDDGYQFLLFGGKSSIKALDNNSIHLSHGDRYEPFELKVDRKFIKSLKVIDRKLIVALGSGIEALIPSNPKEPMHFNNVEMKDDNYIEDSFRPSTVQTLLKAIRKYYITPKAKKKKKKKKKDRVIKKGTKITPSKWKEGMVFNIEAVDWDESSNKLNPAELYLVFKGKLKNVHLYFLKNGNYSVDIPGIFNYANISADIVKSITLAKDYVPPSDEGSAPEGLIVSRTIGNQRMDFFENRVRVGCKTFQLKTVKKLYHALCKVYGEPK